MILHVLQKELGQQPQYHPLPDFSWSVGGITLLRDGSIVSDKNAEDIFILLSSLGLCDYPYMPKEPAISAIAYPTDSHDGHSLLNLFCMISAHQYLLNQALGAKSAFYIAPGLMDMLLEHPPVTYIEFIQTLYLSDGTYHGIGVNPSFIHLTGFSKCKSEEGNIHRQLADLMISASKSLNYTKAYPRNVRNRKYAFRTWLNSIGMAGPAYEEARRTMLSRLYGCSKHRAIPRKGV